MPDPVITPAMATLIASVLAQSIGAGMGISSARKAGEIEEEDIAYRRGKTRRAERRQKRLDKEEQARWEKEFAESLRRYSEEMGLSKEKFQFERGQMQDTHRVQMKKANLVLGEMINRSKFRRALSKAKFGGIPAAGGATTPATTPTKPTSAYGGV